MQDNTDQLLTHSDLQDAQKLTRKVRARLEAEAPENRRANNTVYLNLALISGGTVALSITYLGYLKGGSRPVIHSQLVVASWACLLAAVPLGLFYPVLHTSYTYYARMREYLDARVEQRTAEAEGALKLNVVGLDTPQEREREAARLRDVAKEFRTQADRCRRREDLYSFLFRWSGLAAKSFFIAGLALLFWFATSNTP